MTDTTDEADAARRQREAYRDILGFDPAQIATDAANDREALKRCVPKDQWERDFIRDMRSRLDQGHGFTDKQRAIVNRMLGRAP